MKKLVFLRENPKAHGGAELYLKWLKQSLEKLGLKGSVRGYEGRQKGVSWLKALRFNAQAKKQKHSDELYFSLARIDSADIVRTDDGVHKIYRNTKKLWFLNPLNFVHPYLEKKCFNNAKCIIAISQMVKKQIISCYGIDENKIKVLYNGVEFPENLDKIRAKKELCDELKIDNSLPLILYVGSGFKRKGVKEIILALKELKKPYNAVFVGKDKKSEFYEKLAKNLGVNAIFTGARGDAKRFFEASDIFVILATYEPFGLAILEAMSYENAVIASTNCGASELLEKEFIASDFKNASEILSKLLENSELQKQNAIKNRQKSRKFSLENNAKETLELIKSYL